MVKSQRRQIRLVKKAFYHYGYSSYQSMKNSSSSSSESGKPVAASPRKSGCLLALSLVGTAVATGAAAYWYTTTQKQTPAAATPLAPAAPAETAPATEASNDSTDAPILPTESSEEENTDSSADDGSSLLLDDEPLADTFTEEEPAAEPDIEPAREVAESEPPAHDYGMEGMEWKRDALLNRLSPRARESLAELNAQAEASMSASDYLQLLAGENHLLSTRDNRRESEKEALAKLQTKVRAILENPQDEMTFARTHFMDPPQNGISFRYHLLYTRDSLSYADDEFIVEHGPGLTTGEGYTSLIKLWDARTCRLQGSVAYPSLPGEVKRVRQGAAFVVPCNKSEVAGSTWAWEHPNCILDLTTRQVLPLSDGSQANLTDKQRREEEMALEQQYGSRFRLNEQQDLCAGRLQQTRGLFSLGYELNEYGHFHRKKALDFYTKGSFPNRKGLLTYALGRRDGDEETVCSIDFTHLSRASRKQSVRGYEGIWLSYDGGDWPDNTSGATKYSRISDDASAFDSRSRIIRDLKRKNLAEYCENGDYARTWELVKGYQFFSVGDGEQVGATMGYQEAGLLSPSGEILLFPVSCAFADGEYAWPEGRTEPLQALSRLRVSNDGVGNYMNHITYGVCAEETDDGGMEIVLIVRQSLNGYGVALFRTDAGSKNITLVKRFKAAGAELAPVWLPEKRLLLLPEGDRKYNICTMDHDGQTTPVADLYMEPLQQGYAVVLPNGHYAGSPGCESFLSYTKNGRTIGMEALAPWRNRPAEVLEALNGNADDIAALRETTKRWLKKKGYEADNMPPEPSPFALPVAKVELPPLYPPTAQLEFQVELQATARSIRSLKVLAGGIEVPQDAPVSVPPGETAVVTVNVPLAAGQNWLEVAAEDSAGLQGETTRFRVINNHAAEPELYVLALGVSEYQDENLRLQYAAKDAQDVAEAFRNMNNGNNHVLCLTDDKVRKDDALNKMEGFLAAANIDDIVVVYIAGHGFLDEKLNYYYAPADTDVDRLAESAISMDDLTSALQRCAARRRLLLMDTCHAGMVGEEGAEQLAALGMNLPQGVRAVQTRGMKVKGTPALRTDAARKRYIEEMYSADSTQRGINIIAGSAGAEFARESDRWNNGVFTASLLEALGGQADEDRNGKLTVAELAVYLRNEVAAQTNAAQKPDLVAKENEGDMVLCAVSAAPTRSGNTAETPQAPVPTLSTEDRSDLQPLIDRMARLKCKQAISAYQQQQLLILLPRIRNGESVDITTPDMAGHTALHYACGIGSLSITTWLVKHGANVNAAADNGDTPLSSVGADNRAAITKLLKEHGAGSGVPSVAPTVSGAENGPVSAEEQCDLGYKYQFGKGVPQSYDKAFYWYEKAAAQGLPVAHNNLAFCYLNGWGCKKNEFQAYTHFKIAAEAGVPLAQSNLGTCYEFGNGVKRDKAEAIRWYRMGAAQGNESAKKHLKRLGL